MASGPDDFIAAPPKTAETEAMFGDGVDGPPPTEEAPPHVLDEFSAASLSAPAFTAERPSHLGGPRERVVPAMPAVVRTIGARKIDPHAPDPRDPFAHLDLRINPAPSEEDRQRTARRTVETRDSSEHPYLYAALLAITVALLTMLVWMFGNRVFG